MKLNQQPTFETLQDLDNITLKSMIGLDFLKLRVVMKNKGKTNEVYDTLVKQLSHEGKLSEYFQNFQELNQYLKKNENIKVDTQKKSLEIIGKGPTKKANHVQIAQLKLLPIQLTSKSNLSDSKTIREKHNISSQEAEEWMDTLATQIVSIIQHKSRITQQSSSLSQYVKKTQLEQILSEAKKQVKTQIQILKEIIKNLQQNNKKIKIQQNQLKKVKHFTQNNEKDKRNKQQIKQLQKKIKQISQKVDKIIEQNTQITIKLIKQQTEKMSQNLIMELDAKSLQNSKLYSKKQEMDVIIKKIQQIGSKVQFISNETVKKQQEKEKSQENPFFKPNGIHLTSPKKSHSKFDNDTSFRAERIGNNKKASDYVPQTPVNADTWIDPKCSHFGRVSLKCNTITINSYGGAHLFGKIPMKSNSIFNILIEQLTGKMAIGVADSSYKQNLLFGDQPNQIYYQSNRRFYDGVKQKQDEGEGFTKGEIITVCVDLKLGTILWKVEGKLRHSWQSDELRNQKIAWVPYIRLFQKGDVIQILE